MKTAENLDFWFRNRNSIFLASVILCILLFLLSGVDKLVEHVKFRNQLGMSPLIGSYYKFLSWFIPSLEIVISLFIAWKKTRRIGLYSFYVLMLLFTGYIILFSTRKDAFQCGCNFLIDKMGPAGHVVLNVVFILLSGLALHLEKNTEINLSYYKFKHLFHKNRKEVLGR